MTVENLSHHKEWVNANFDVISVNINDKIYCLDYDFNKYMPKWAAMDELLNEINYKKYKSIWFPDGDVRMDTNSINYMFKFFSFFGFLFH